MFSNTQIIRCREINTRALTMRVKSQLINLSSTCFSAFKMVLNVGGGGPVVVVVVVVVLLKVGMEVVDTN